MPPKVNPKVKKTVSITEKFSPNRKKKDVKTRTILTLEKKDVPTEKPKKESTVEFVDVVPKKRASKKS